MKFYFKSFEEMTYEDYSKIGFKCGLEVHQQLLTKKKLFCRCPAGKYSEHYDARILRHMRPTLSELGEYDGTALMEFKTKKNIIYQINSETVCTYEMDDAPPFEINDNALDIALEIGMMFKCYPVGELHVTRKQYLDGSIPTGFQRTGITGVGGSFFLEEKEIGIIQISIEEDSCREVSDNEHVRVYNTDRLGMPLVEIVTQADMKTPQEIEKVVQKIRKITRATDKVRTGYGAARQDVNISVTGGTRIEVKGVPQATRIPRIAYNEARRQWTLLRIRDELLKRGLSTDNFNPEYINATKLVSNTYFEPIKDILNKNGSVYALKLEKFTGIFTIRTQEYTHFSKEFSDRIRVIACINEPNMTYSESMEVDPVIWRKIKDKLKGTEEDIWVLVWGNDEDAKTAVNEIIIRAKEAIIGVPSETRQALKNGTTGFERILPGPDRMYPDTDLPPIPISDKRLNIIKQTLPESPDEQFKKYKELNLSDELAESLVNSKWRFLFEEVIQKYNIKPSIAAYLFTGYFKHLKRNGYNLPETDNKIWHEIFNYYKERRFYKEAFPDIVKKLTSKETPETIINKMSPTLNGKMDSIIDETLIIYKYKNYKDSDKKIPFLMGQIMYKYGGSLDASLLYKKLTERIK